MSRYHQNLQDSPCCTASERLSSPTRPTQRPDQNLLVRVLQVHQLAEPGKLLEMQGSEDRDPGPSPIQSRFDPVLRLFPVWSGSGLGLGPSSGPVLTVPSL